MSAFPSTEGHGYQPRLSALHLDPEAEVRLAETLRYVEFHEMETTDEPRDVLKRVWAGRGRLVWVPGEVEF